MTPNAPLRPNWRSPRVSLPDTTPAVLRLADGSAARGNLKTISLTGGMLDVSNAVDRGARVKLMFMTQMGPVLGTAEMLHPVSTSQQPFRFVSLEERDQRRLRAVVGSPQVAADAWIEKYRAALDQEQRPRRGIFKAALAALTIGALGLGSAFYLLHLHLK